MKKEDPHTAVVQHHNWKKNNSDLDDMTFELVCTIQTSCLVAHSTFTKLNAAFEDIALGYIAASIENRPKTSCQNN